MTNAKSSLVVYTTLLCSAAVLHTHMSDPEDDPAFDPPIDMDDIEDWKRVLNTCIHGIPRKLDSLLETVNTPSQNAFVSYLIERLVKAKRTLSFSEPNPGGYVVIRVVSWNENREPTSTLWVEVGPLDLHFGNCEVVISKERISLDKYAYVKESSQRCAACDKPIDYKE